MSDQPIERLVFQAGRLMREHPPIWRHPNKEAVFAVSSPPGAVHGGRIEYSRWRAMRLPDEIRPALAREGVVRREGFYDYVPSAEEDVLEWHVNFADPHLFVAYGSALLAQDELQTAEHPVLGALREALLARGYPAMTEDESGPTPVLVMGAERRCRIDLEPDPARGRPEGLYGNAFARAPAAVVRAATRPVDPPTVTNLIAMAAPPPATGPYAPEEIERALVTAHTGFRAAVLVSRPRRAVIHTGFWGCGAFGGNRQLMALLQMLAASTAGVFRLVFHSAGARDREAYDQALFRIGSLFEGVAVSPRMAVARIADAGYEWGVSDGN